MGFSSAVIVSVLFFYVFHTSASVIPDGKKVESKDSGEFKVHIMEKGTKYAEKIKVDEDNDIEYFHVPAHNGLTEADYLYDFRSKMAVSRVKSDGKCYLGPLPDNLPNPADLKTGLQTVSQSPPSGHIFIVQKYWAVSEQVDKTLLRQEVQDFCGQFPVFRLREVDLNSAASLDGRRVGQTGLARNTRSIPANVPFCSQISLSVGNQCNPEKWIFSLKIRDRHCTWWITCKFSTQSKKVCEDWEHKFSSMICYDISCP